MKKSVLFILAAFVAITLNAQKVASDNLPAAVNTSFKAKFSIAEKTTWEMDYDNYKANFTVGKSEFSAIFDKDGKWLETDTYMKSTELPKAVRETLAKKYGELSAYKIDDSEKVETEKSTFYRLEIIKGEVTYEIEINEKGNISKDEIKTESKND
ncbi:MAG: PepSY-like domain-containing protein [Bacteroidetes bacterium]|nr:PepSY-like domain-containing protein [Bacteroidota bacterium]